MNAELTLSRVYGSCTSAISAYNEKTGELFVGVGRRVKKMRIRSGASSIIKLETEGTILSISVEDEFLLALDETSRIYLYNLFYDAEIGRMHTRECSAAYVKDSRVFLDYMGYLQIWIPADNGFFTFRKENHITGHQDSIHLIVRTEEGVVTASKDGTLREYREKENTSIRVWKNKSKAISARKVNNELFCIWGSGEISRFAYMSSEWTQIQRKFTFHSLVSADISTLGDLSVVLDTEGTVYLYSTTADTKEPIGKISAPPGTVQVKFIEQDEWILVSGNGSVVWEWKTDTLLFNEHSSACQRVAKDVGPSVVSGTETGDVFIWDKGSSVCTKKISDHSSAITAIHPLQRGFVSASANGDCKVHKFTGEVVKKIECGISILVADADEDLLAVAGPGSMHIYDIKRSKKIQEYETDMPLAIKIVGSDVILATMSGLAVYSPTSVIAKDGPEQFVLSAITETRNGLEIICLGDSGVAYSYNRDIEETGEYRLLPEYTNGLGKNTPLSIAHTKEGDVVVTYKVLRPDRKTQSRETIYGSIFKNTQEIDRWKVLEEIGNSSGFLFIEERPMGESIGVCSENGLLMFSDAGARGNALWQNETPAELERKIEDGSDVLGGMVGAVKLNNKRIFKHALMKGDASVLGRYLPDSVVEQAIPHAFNAMSDGLVEKSLAFIQEVTKRTGGSGTLRRLLALILSYAADTTHETTGYADALMEFSHLAKEEIETNK